MKITRFALTLTVVVGLLLASLPIARMRQAPTGSDLPNQR